MRGKVYLRYVELLPLGITPAYAGKSLHPSEMRLSSGRITPAYAGKRLACKPRQRHMEDHPRLCGEKNEVFRNFITNVRITPAYAGKSVKICSRRPALRDHPRLCGEKHTNPLELLF